VVSSNNAGVILAKKPSSHQFTTDCQAIIRWCFGRQVDSGRISLEDRRDLEQEISLHVWIKLAQYDPSRGSLSTFISRTVSRKLIDVRRFHEAKFRRAPTVTLSLDRKAHDESSDDEPRAVWEAADTDAHRHRCLAGPRNDLPAMKSDVHATLSDFPDDLVQTCRLLTCCSLSETARQLGIGRSTLYKRIERIRSRFVDASLDAYL